MEFPRFVFRSDGLTYAQYLVLGQDEMDAKLSEGWSETILEAMEPKAAPDPVAVPADDAPPTRAELEAKATELGIHFDGRLKDKTLADKIAVALEEQKDEA